MRRKDIKDRVAEKKVPLPVSSTTGSGSPYFKPYAVFGGTNGSHLIVGHRIHPHISIITMVLESQPE